MKRIPVLSRAGIARKLESEHAWLGSALLATAFGLVSRHGMSRPLALPDGARVIGVGGATLGGSGKTPLAIALARVLAERGERVAFIGHAYRARPRFARIVTRSDEVREVGDEALLAARMLEPWGVEVIVAKTRQASVSFAARRASWLVVDGLLQTRPRRLSGSVLALDAHLPWGNGRFPPSGDLRAPRDSILDATDVVAIVRDERGPASAAIEVGGKRAFDVITRLDGARDRDGRDVALHELASRRVGLLLMVARPERVAHALAQRGIYPLATVALGDHDRPGMATLKREIAAAHPVDAWLTTAKCATKLPRAIRGTPVLVLGHEVELPGGLISALVGA